MNYELRTIRQSSIVSRQCSGFSLIEMLLAMGILGIGLVLVAMVFPVGIKLTSIAVDRTIGAIAANEAVAKIQLYGLPPFADWTLAAGTPNPEVFPHTQCTQCLPLLNYKYGAAVGWPKDLTWDEFLYPSVNKLDLPDGQERNTHWSALCFGVNNSEIQVTVFVTHKMAAGMQYYSWNHILNQPGVLEPGPSPVLVKLQYNGNPKELKVTNSTWGATENGFFDDNVTIVEDSTGRIYRVQEYKVSVGGIKDTLVLKDAWKWPDFDLGAPSPANGPIKFWVVPPAVGSDRYPVIAVTQTMVTIK